MLRKLALWEIVLNQIKNLPGYRLFVALVCWISVRSKTVKIGFKGIKFHAYWQRRAKRRVLNACYDLVDAGIVRVEFIKLSSFTIADEQPARKIKVNVRIILLRIAIQSNCLTLFENIFFPVG